MKLEAFVKYSVPALLIGLLSSCGDAGPVGHVDFDTEFQDTSKVKSKVTEYGAEQEKEYKDLLLVEKDFDVNNSDIDRLFSTAQTATPHNNDSRVYKSQLTLDTEVQWDKADSFLNNASVAIPVKTKKCDYVSLAISVYGINLEFKVSTGPMSWFYSFDDYKHNCVDELKSALYVLSNAKKFEFTYLHLQRATEPGLKEFAKTKLKITPLERTTLVRKLYKVKPQQLREAFDNFLAEFKKTEAPLSDPKDPSSERLLRDGNITIQLDKNPTTLTATGLKLNGKKDQKDLDEWKQGVYDPASGVVRSVFTPIFMMPFEVVTRAVLNPFANLGDEPIFKSFLFEKCNNVYISTTLSGVTMRIEEPRSRQDADACYAELESFFNGRPVKFDYIRSTKIEN